jgi:CTP synthase
VLGCEDATSEEMGPGTHVIAILPEQEDVEGLGGTMRLGDWTCSLTAGTTIAKLYESEEIVERHRHRYEVNPDYIADLENAGLVFSGRCGMRMEACEIPGHPFFIATQFHPEFRSRPTQPSPPYIGFVRACRENRNSGQE